MRTRLIPTEGSVLLIITVVHPSSSKSSVQTKAQLEKTVFLFRKLFGNFLFSFTFFSFFIKACSVNTIIGPGSHYFPFTDGHRGELHHILPSCWDWAAPQSFLLVNIVNHSGLLSALKRGHTAADTLITGSIYFFKPLPCNLSVLPTVGEGHCHPVVLAPPLLQISLKLAASVKTHVLQKPNLGNHDCRRRKTPVS